MILKFLASATLVLLFSGCDYHSDEYLAFHKKYGSSYRHYCSENGFLTKEYMPFNQSTAPSRKVVLDQQDKPIQCTVDSNGTLYSRKLISSYELTPFPQ